jgi:hypothetical protein
MMEEFSNTTVWELLKVMQQKVKSNASLIQKNVNSVELLKNKYGHSKKREKIIDSIYKQNYELTQENTSLLQLHNLLYNFYKNFKDLLRKPIIQIDQKVETDEISLEEFRKNCMDKTISGEMKIDKRHPYINDPDFLSDLMEHCQNMELYERCSEIKKAKAYSHRH